MSLTPEELCDGIGAAEGYEGRVHLTRDHHLTGRQRHLYIYRGGIHLTNDELADISHRSGDVEVSLMRIDGIDVLYIGSTGMARALVLVPRREDGVERFEFVAHTHPLEMDTAYEGVARGPTPEDRRALAEIHRRWGQADSSVIVCRGGRVREVVPYHVELDIQDPHSGGRIWHPPPD